MDRDNDTIGRFGKISAVDASKHQARVEFPDLGIVSGWLPVGIPCAGKAKYEHMPDIGEHVYCLMHENTGVVLCSIYDAKNMPEKGKQDIQMMKFDDGTEIYYDRAKHELSITDSYGTALLLDKEGISGVSGKNISLSDKKGNTIRTDDGGISIVSEKSLEITDGSGGVISMGSGGITIHSPAGVNVTGIKGLSGISGGAMSIVSGGAMSLSAAGSMNMKAGRFNFE